MSGRTPPARTYEMTIRIGADSMEDLARAFDRLSRKAELGEFGPDGCSGGWSYDWSYRLVHDPQMTGDLYREQIIKWQPKDAGHD